LQILHQNKELHGITNCESNKCLLILNKVKSSNILVEFDLIAGHKGNQGPHLRFIQPPCKGVGASIGVPFLLFMVAQGQG